MSEENKYLRVLFLRGIINNNPLAVFIVTKDYVPSIFRFQDYYVRLRNFLCILYIYAFKTIEIGAKLSRGTMITIVHISIQICRIIVARMALLNLAFPRILIEKVYHVALFFESDFCTTKIQ